MIRPRVQITPKRVVKSLLLAAGIFYLSYHALHGERGLYALVRETHHREELQKEIADVKAQREVLDRRVSHLRSDSLDLDLLDEQMRRMLGTIGKNEVLVIDEDPNS